MAEYLSENEMRQENERLRKRLNHLLQSETIKLFNETIPGTGEYKRDIRRLDTYGLKYKLLQAEKEGRAMDQYNEPRQAKKPPLGIKPRWLHDYERMADLADAMQRYEKASCPIPPEWLDELKELFCRMIERYNHGTE